MTRRFLKNWSHPDHPEAKYDADVTMLKGVRKFRLELTDWHDRGQDKLPPQRKYFKSWQEAVKKGWRKE